MPSKPAPLDSFDHSLAVKAAEKRFNESYEALQLARSRGEPETIIRRLRVQKSRRMADWNHAASAKHQFERAA